MRKSTKRLLSGVTAAVIFTSTTFLDTPTNLFQYSYAHAELSDFEYKYETSPLAISVKKDSNGNPLAESVTTFSVDGVKKGETTIAELRNLYSGITVSGFSFKNSTYEGLTADDIHWSISILSGANYDGWHSVTDESTLDLSDISSEYDSNVVQDFYFHIYIGSDAITRLSMNYGDAVLINKDENAPKIAHIHYDGRELGGYFADESWGMSYTASYNIELDGVDSTTTVAEFKKMYSGILFDNFTIESLSDDRIPISDIKTKIIIQTGTNSSTDYSGWSPGPYDSIYYDSSYLDNVPDTYYIRSIWFDVGVGYDPDDTVFKENDMVFINPVEGKKTLECDLSDFSLSTQASVDENGLVSFDCRTTGLFKNELRDGTVTYGDMKNKYNALKFTNPDVYINGTKTPKSLFSQFDIHISFDDNGSYGSAWCKNGDYPWIVPTTLSIAAYNNENALISHPLSDNATLLYFHISCSMKDVALEGISDGDVIVIEFSKPVVIDETNFPDAIFRNYVSQNFDKDSDGILLKNEISHENFIDVEEMGISDLKGIEYFTNLEYLLCGENNLTSLDLSQNTDLTILMCNNSNLTTLDVSKNTELTGLWLSNNNLTSFDVSKNTALTELVCQNNNLTTLDVSKNTALKYLWCNNTNLSTLDVSKNTALENLHCYKNNLTTLDLNYNTALTELYCEQNNLTSLDLSKNTLLEEFKCDDNQYTITSASLNELTENGFDASKASNWTGAEYDAATNSLKNIKADKVTYDYDTEYQSVTFTLVIDLDDDNDNDNTSGDDDNDNDNTPGDDDNDNDNTPGDDDNDNDNTPGDDDNDDDNTPGDDDNDNDNTPGDDDNDNDNTPGDDDNDDDNTPGDDDNDNDNTPGDDDNDNDNTPGDDDNDNDNTPGDDDNDNDNTPGDDDNDNDNTPGDDDNDNDNTPGDDDNDNDNNTPAPKTETVPAEDITTEQKTQLEQSENNTFDESSAAENVTNGDTQAHKDVKTDGKFSLRIVQMVDSDLLKNAESVSITIYSAKADKYVTITAEYCCSYLDINGTKVEAENGCSFLTIVIDNIKSDDVITFTNYTINYKK